jgi:hypothetical protein
MTDGLNESKGQAGQTCLPLSVFPGRTICKGPCGMPVRDVSPRGFCMTCEDNTKAASTIAVLAAQIPKKGFRDAINEVRRNSQPMSLAIADAAMAELGGEAELGRMIVRDLRTVKGEHLPEDLKAFHDTDWKVAKGLTEILVKLASDRDKLVGETADPLADVSETDLMAIAAQAALLQIETDAEFRLKILDMIVEIDPEMVLQAAGRAIDRLESGPKVEVIDAKST